MGNACCSSNARRVTEPTQKLVLTIPLQPNQDGTSSPSLNICSNQSSHEHAFSIGAASPQRLGSTDKMSLAGSNVSTMRKCQRAIEIDSWVGVVIRESIDPDCPCPNEGVNIEFTNGNYLQGLHRLSDISFTTGNCGGVPMLQRTNTPFFKLNSIKTGPSKKWSMSSMKSLRKPGTLSVRNPASSSSSPKAKVRHKRTLSHFSRARSNCEYDVGSPILRLGSAFSHGCREIDNSKNFRSGSAELLSSYESPPGSEQNPGPPSPRFYHPLDMQSQLKPVEQVADNVEIIDNRACEDDKLKAKGTGRKGDASPKKTGLEKSAYLADTKRLVTGSPRKANSYFSVNYKSVVFKDVLKAAKETALTEKNLSSCAGSNSRRQSQFPESAKGPPSFRKEKPQESPVPRPSLFKEPINVTASCERTDPAADNKESATGKGPRDCLEEKKQRTIPANPRPPIPRKQQRESSSAHQSSFPECWSASHPSNPLETSPPHYLMISQLGMGPLGPVKLGFDANQHRNVAVKFVARNKIKKSFQTRSTLIYRMFQGEIATFKKIVHPHLVRFLQAVDDPKSSYLLFVSEYVPNGDLLHLVKEQGRLEPEVARKYWRDIVSAVDYGHVMAEVAHRSVGLHNVMIGEGGEVKVADLGHKFISEEEDKDDLNAAYYSAPELCKGLNKGTKSDIWALGICLYYMIKGVFPFNGSTVEEVINEVRTKPIDFDGIADGKLKDLLQKILEKDAGKRITMKELKKHGWVSIEGKHKLPEYQGEEISITEEDRNNAVATSCIIEEKKQI